jgi:hypothetical protein
MKVALDATALGDAVLGDAVFLLFAAILLFVDWNSESLVK